MLLLEVPEERATFPFKKPYIFCKKRLHTLQEFAKMMEPSYRQCCLIQLEPLATTKSAAERLCIRAPLSVI